MCPRATAQHCAAAAMASVCSFVEEEYIDLDLSSYGELEFRVRRSGAAADELLCRGKLAAAVPRHKAAPPRPGGKVQEVDAGSGGAGRRSAATVAPLQHSHSAGFRDAPSPVVRLRKEGSRRRKAARTVHAKLLASRAFFRSLFARTSCSDEQCRGAEVRARARAAAAPPPSGEAKSSSCCKAPFGQIKNCYHQSSGRAAPTTLRSSIEQEKLMDEEELAAAAAVRQRKSFSGVIKWRHAAAAPAPPASKPLSSSSARRSSGGGGGPGLKRSSSARSESEGLIQGAIAYCKRSQQQLGLGRKSVSDAALCSAAYAAAPSSWPGNPARSAAVAYCH
ncbi:unnamed protein product [Urochloa decumbens]|uniref:Uncharacterized protein n=1 Tax=Urochloa decumbens TaxID=240449 RepID=A0ABC8X786_9POAL